MEGNTTLNTLLGILDLGIEPNQYLLLKAIKEESWEVIRDLDNLKLSGWKQTLTRKGFLFDNGTLSPSGESLLTGNFSEVKVVKRKAKVEATTDFGRWWEVYPKSDRFVHKNRTFMGTQKKNIKEDLCAAKFDELVKSGKYTAEQIIQATKSLVLEAKELSIKEGKNKLSFIPNSERFLREEHFSEHISKEQPRLIGIVDI